MTPKKNISGTAFRSKITQTNTGPIWLVIILVVFSELLVYTWVRTESTHGLLRISKAEEVLLKKQSHQKNLLLEKEWLTSDERITAIGRTHLNLSTVTLNQTIYISGDAD